MLHPTRVSRSSLFIRVCEEERREEEKRREEKEKETKKEKKILMCLSGIISTANDLYQYGPHGPVRSKAKQVLIAFGSYQEGAGGGGSGPLRGVLSATVKGVRREGEGKRQQTNRV